MVMQRKDYLGKGKYRRHQNSVKMQSKGDILRSIDTSEAFSEKPRRFKFIEKIPNSKSKDKGFV